MRREYDFSKGVRGKFYRPGAKLLIPVYLEPKVQAFVADRAAKDGVGVSDVVNDMLRRDIATEPGKPKKSSSARDPKRESEVVLLLGTNVLRAQRSRSGTKLYAVRDTQGRSYRLNPIRRAAKTRAHASKKSKRAKR
jgi:hypothetical protein